ncbi:MAG: hypothetical protein ACREO0_08340 [Pseudoxanthomonas sp.]
MKTNPRTKWTMKFALALVATSPLALMAQESAPPLDRVYLSGGIYQNHTQFKVRWDYVDGSAPGTPFDYEKAMGFPRFSEQLWEAGATVAGAHRFQVFGWRFDGDVVGKVRQTAFINGSWQAAGDSVNGSLEVDQKGAAYTWFFNRDDRSAFGVGVGAIRYRISSKLYFDKAGFPGVITIDNKFDTAFDMPLARAEYARSLGNYLRAGADISYLRKSSGSMTGSGFDTNVSIEYLPAPLVSFGLRYNVYRLDLEKEATVAADASNGLHEFQGPMKIRNRGPQLFMTIRY